MFYFSGREGMKFTTHVNEDKGVVAVRIMNGMDQMMDEYQMFCRKYEAPFDRYYIDSFIKKYGKQIDKLVGLATCNTEAGDTFDIEFSTRLAQERAMTCFEGYRTKFYTGLCLKMDCMAESASKRAEKSDERRCARIDRVNDLIEELKH